MTQRVDITAMDHDGQQWVVQCSIHLPHADYSGTHWVTLDADATQNQLEAALLAQYGVEVGA